LCKATLSIKHSEAGLVTLLVIGLNHHTTPVELREKLYLRSEKLYPILTELHRHSTVIEETAILSTCNRLEVYVAMQNVIEAERTILDFMSQYYEISEAELRPFLYVHQGRMAIQHLMRVSAGLDSMVLGETQILGQVGDALKCAATVSTTGPLLHRLFEASMHAGKRARSETAISRHTTSISHAAALLVRNRLTVENSYILVVGAGEMAEVAVQAVHNSSLTNIGIINRTFAHAQNLAGQCNAQAHEWSQLWEQLAIADVIITATGAPHTLLYDVDIQRVMKMRDNKALMLVDIAVPRDIDSAASNIEGVTLYDIDALQDIVDESLAAREACVPTVKNIISEEVERYQNWLNERNVVPVIKDLRREIESVIQTELQATLVKLPELSEQEQEIVKRMAHRIMNKVLHTPTISLREQASNGNGEDFANVVRELFSLNRVEAQEDELYV
jgi:glutamyl-tRNA reductase